MNKRAKWGLGLIIAFFSFSLIKTEITLASDKKMKVVTEVAAVHLNPDERSPVLEKLERGTIIGLLSAGRFKTYWYYISYKSTSGLVKSGYIHQSAVEPLFQAQRVITIKGDGSPVFFGPLFSYLDSALWGASKEKVISLEGEPDKIRRLENVEVFEYYRDLKDYEAFREYIFNNNQLIQMRLELWQIAGQKNELFRAYGEFKNHLEAKFGSPFEDVVKWENPAFKHDELSWGYALSLGHLIYQSRWFSSNLELLLRLRGENKSILLEFEGIQAGFKELAKKVARAGSFRSHLPRPQD